MRGVELHAVQIGRLGSSPFPAQFVAQAIDHRLAQIGLERADPTRLEVPDPLKRLKQGVLDKIVGIGEIARPARQPSARPSLQRTEVSREQPFQRFLIPLRARSISSKVDSGSPRSGACGSSCFEGRGRS